MSIPGGSDPSGPSGPGKSGSQPSGQSAHRPAWLVALGRRRWIAALVAIALVVAAGIAVFSLNRAGQEAQPAATQTQSPSETPAPVRMLTNPRRLTRPAL